MALELDRTMREPPAPSIRPLASPAPQPQDAQEAVALADVADSADLLGVAEAVEPLAELSLSPLAQTPLLIGLVGPSGSGKSFALQRLAGAVETLAAAAGAASGAVFHSRIAVARLDAAGLSGDPASALASAAFVALERERGGVSYHALADEAAHATTDPRRAATAAAERHDDVSRRLEAERAARDEVESKRARLFEALLYETPGSRVDTMIRTSRPTIEARLRRFGLAEDDSAANYRDLVRDLSSLGAASRYTLALRAIWAYRGQTTLLLIAVLAILAGVGIDKLRTATAEGVLGGFAANAAPAIDWLHAHAAWAENAVDALFVIALAAALLNVWRALSFSTLLYRGLRLLNIDVRERRRELDASAARLERRVAALSGEAEAASQRAETLARRVGGGANVSRAPGPVFLRSQDAPARTAREFFAELARLMSAPAAKDMPKPQRLIFVVDNLEVLAPDEAARLIRTARALFGVGCVGLIACDPASISPADPRGFERSHFDVVFDPAAVAATDGGRVAARLFASGPQIGGGRAIDPHRSALAEPLSPTETAVLTALAPLTAATPRAIKRLHNAYRLARLSKAPRPLVALMLAALQIPDGEAAKRLRAAMLSPGERLEPFTGPASLVAAIEAVEGAQGRPIAKADARAAWDAARRYAPIGF